MRIFPSVLRLRAEKFCNNVLLRRPSLLKRDEIINYSKILNLHMKNNRDKVTNYSSSDLESYPKEIMGNDFKLVELDNKTKELLDHYYDILLSIASGKISLISKTESELLYNQAQKYNKLSLVHFLSGPSGIQNSSGDFILTYSPYDLIIYAKLNNMNSGEFYSISPNSHLPEPDFPSFDDYKKDRISDYAYFPINLNLDKTNSDIFWSGHLICRRPKQKIKGFLYRDPLSFLNDNFYENAIRHQIS